MIITKLMGGLGNQMFQYAAGRRLAYSLGVELKLDISGFPDQNYREYSLDPFNIVSTFASWDEIFDLKFQKPGIFDRILRRPAKKSSRYIRERDRNFCPEVLTLPDGVSIDGYWQSEKYFKAIESIINKEFKIKVPQTGRNRLLSESISESESVCIHIRRGDYVANSVSNTAHGLCSLDYYHRCLEYLKDYVSKFHLFIFTDDPDWVKDNIKFAYETTYVDHNNDKKSFEDMRLMSQCKHNIIANSSFSWWGAWLNGYPQKKVIAPKYWFNNTPYKDKDRLPKKWIRINNR